MKIALSVLEKVVFFALVVLVPSQLALHFWPKYSFVFGIPIDYLSPSVYLTDIFVAVLLFLWALRAHNIVLKIAAKYKYAIFAAAFLVFLNIAFSIRPEVSFYKWVKISEFALFSFYVSKNVPLGSLSKIVELLFISMIPSVFLGMYNFFLGRTYGGAFYFLGERTFDISTPGIALVQLFGQDFIRPYGTFSHPNSLAGFTGILILLYLFGKFRKNIWTKFIFFLTLLVFLMAYSVSAYIGLVLAIFRGLVAGRKVAAKPLGQFILYGSAFVSLLFMAVSPRLVMFKNFNSSTTERIMLATKSLNIVSTKGLTGVGLGNFVSAPSTIYNQWTNQSSLQPVHNIFLLVFSETGLLIFIPALYLLHLQIKKTSSYKHGWIVAVALFVLSTGLLDHYWITLQQNLLLLSLLAGVSLIKK